MARSSLSPSPLKAILSLTPGLVMAWGGEDPGGNEHLNLLRGYTQHLPPK